MLIGGCINGQLITWDLGSTDLIISDGRAKPTTDAAAPEGDEEDKSQ